MLVENLNIYLKILEYIYKAKTGKKLTFYGHTILIGGVCKLLRKSTLHPHGLFRYACRICINQKSNQPL